MQVAGFWVAGVMMAAAGGQASPPIFHPGAPGQPTRTITADQALALSRTTFTPGDVAFMQHMLVHHAQAVEMVALLDRQGADATVKRLGQRIALSQEAEMALMRGWLTERGQSLEMPGMAHSGMPGMTHADHAGMAGMSGMEGHAMAASTTPLMPGMLSPAQMQTLAAAQGIAFDRLFLQGMVQHHKGALDMVSGLLEQPGAAEDPMLSDFTTSVVADQSAEILRMQNILSGL